MRDYLSGVSRVCLGSRISTIDNFGPSTARVIGACPGCLGLCARARAYVYKSLFRVFSFMRELKTLSTLDTLSRKIKVTVFKRVLMSRVLSRVGRFLSRVGISGDFQ